MTIAPNSINPLTLPSVPLEQRSRHTEEVKLEEGELIARR